jgi:hypothetical protein
MLGAQKENRPKAVLMLLPKSGIIFSFASRNPSPLPQPRQWQSRTGCRVPAPAAQYRPMMRPTVIGPNMPR